MTLEQFFELLIDKIGYQGLLILAVIMIALLMKLLAIDHKKTYIALKKEGDSWLELEKAKPRCLVRLVLHSGEQFKTQPFEPKYEIIMANNSINKKTSKQLADREIHSATYKKQFKDGQGCTIPYSNINYIKVEEA